MGIKVSNNLAMRRLDSEGRGSEAQGQETGEVAAVDKVTTMKGEDTLTSCNCEGFFAGGSF